MKNTYFTLIFVPQIVLIIIIIQEQFAPASSYTFNTQNPYLPEYSHPPNPEYMRPHSSNSIENATPL